MGRFRWFRCPHRCVQMPKFLLDAHLRYIFQVDTQNRRPVATLPFPSTAYFIAVFYFVLLALQYGSYVFQTLQFYISVFKLFLQYCISVFQVLQEAEACLLRQIVTTIRILKKSPHFVHVKRRS